MATGDFSRFTGTTGTLIIGTQTCGHFSNFSWSPPPKSTRILLIEAKLKQLEAQYNRVKIQKHPQHHLMSQLEKQMTALRVQLMRW